MRVGRMLAWLSLRVVVTRALSTTSRLPTAVARKVALEKLEVELALLQERGLGGERTVEARRVRKEASLFL
jgi:hypothetical protein